MSEIPSFLPKEPKPPSPETPRRGFGVEIFQPEMLYLLAQEQISKESEEVISVSKTSFGDDVLDFEETWFGVLPHREKPRFFFASILHLPRPRGIFQQDYGFYTDKKIRQIQQGLEERDVSSKFVTEEFLNFLYITRDNLSARVEFGPNGEKSWRQLRDEVRDGKRGLDSYLKSLYYSHRLTIRIIGAPQLMKDEQNFIHTIVTNAKLYEGLIKSIYGEKGRASPNKKIVIRPPIMSEDTITQIKSVETQKPVRVVKEHLKTEVVGFDDIVGQDEAVKEAKNLVLAINHPEIFQKRGVQKPKGILFVGPPGTGKTLIAKAISKEANAQFLEVSAADIVTKWYGESERSLQKVFDNASEAVANGKKVIIFFDEIDALVPSREDANETTRRVVATLLQNMDGMKANPDVTIIAATNRAEDMDPALKRPGRFDKIIPVGLPKKPEERIAVLQLHMNKAGKRTNEPTVLFAQNIDLQQIANLTEGMSHADLMSLINLTLEEKATAELEGTEWIPVDTEDLLLMIDKIKDQKEQKRKLGFIRS